MPSTYEDALHFAGHWVRAGVPGYEGMDAMGVVESRIEGLNVLLDELSALPFADRIRIFGSVKFGADVVPTDVDCFVEDASREEMRVLLRLLQANWGRMDAFVTHGGVLYCQCESDGPEHPLSWVRAGRARPITKAGRSGTPVSQVSWRYAVPERLRHDASPSNATSPALSFP